MGIKTNQTVLFIGDSITDCGRRVTAAPLGAGYVKQFYDMLVVRHPEKDVKVINKGIGGDRVTGLRNRWSDDVLRHAPNYLSIKIGINDLHSHLRETPEPVTPQIFEEAFTDILQQTRDHLPSCDILLISPFYISVEALEMSFRKKVLDLLPQYIDIVQAMSKKFNTMFIDTHKMFQELLEYYDADTFCAEPVHPNEVGHLAIAEAVYEQLLK